MSGQRLISIKDRLALYGRMPKMGAENAIDMAHDTASGASSQVYGVDCIILHVVLSQLEIEPAFNPIFLKKQKLFKPNPGKKAVIPKMIIAMERTGDTIAFCLGKNALGCLKDGARKALQPGEGVEKQYGRTYVSKTREPGFRL